MGDSTQTRRRFLAGLAAAGGGLLGAVASADQDEEKGAKKTLPAEDLMREHGALNRMLLIYEACSLRIAAKKDVDPALVGRTASLLKDFIEGYHEKLEEEHVFPALEKAGVHAELARVLRRQHDAGRRVTARLIQLSHSGSKDELAQQLDAFIRMYRPHEAREDTVAFPAFKKAVPDRQYAELGEKFEAREKKLFGPGGFQGVVARVADLERALGIYDLAQFTPG